MNAPTESTEWSHRFYVWFGFGMGLMTGIFALMNPRFAGFELLNLAGLGAGGALAGSILAQTRQWARRTFTRCVLRVALALAAAAALLLVGASLADLIPPDQVRTYVAMLPAAALVVAGYLVLRYPTAALPARSNRDWLRLGVAAVLSLAWGFAIERAL
jgi:hypothetical protein